MDERFTTDTLKLPAVTTPAVSVVVLLNNDIEQASRCLASLTTGTLGIPAETILVINGADPAIAKFVDDESDGARLISHPVNAGTAACWNLAFAAARAPRALIVHEDAELFEGSVAKLVATMERDHAIGACAPLHTDLHGNVINGGGIRWRDGDWTRITPANHPTLDDLHEPYFVDGIGSAVSLWDLQLWREFGGFDERRFPAVGVDADASTAVWSRGRTCAVVPTARVRHEGGAMDSLPRPLTGARLRWFLLGEYEDFWRDKWSELDDWFLEPDELEDQWRNCDSAVSLGLGNAQARATSGVTLTDAPVAEHPITNPTHLPEWPTALDDEAVRRAQKALAATVERYCDWLVTDEARLRGWAEDLERVVQRQESSLAALREEIASLAHELATDREMLNGIRSGRVWRTRNAVRRVLRLNP